MMISIFVIILANNSLFDIAKQDQTIFNDEVKIPVNDHGEIELT